MHLMDLDPMEYLMLDSVLPPAEMGLLRTERNMLTVAVQSEEPRLS